MRPSLRDRLWARWWLFRSRLEFSERWGVRHLGRVLYVVPRFLDGARPVERGGFDQGAGDGLPPIEGALEEDGISIEFGGACPVQGDGNVEGRTAYYRSRGEGWELEIARAGADVFDDDNWIYAERPYFFPDGGWVSARVSRECIRRAVKAWREAGRP